jgi:hypothetical protein
LGLALGSRETFLVAGFCFVDVVVTTPDSPLTASFVDSVGLGALWNISLYAPSLSILRLCGVPDPELPDLLLPEDPEPVDLEGGVLDEGALLLGSPEPELRGEEGSISVPLVLGVSRVVLLLEPFSEELLLPLFRDSPEDL